ncbi:hypothetical protein GGS24DRAFT_443934 [Hypoxylon argillaceum]|nr:hypothetical protein GGS24DRAFT_443934 [Hypoxylon argillaceum]
MTTIHEMASISPQTLGIQLEFIIFYTNSNNPVSDEEKEKYGLVLEVPEYEAQTDRIYLEARWIRQKVADTITAAGFKARASDKAKDPDPNRLSFWNIVPDPTVVVPADNAVVYRPLKNIGIQVDSPVFVDGENTYTEITTVVKAIRAAFWTAVPPVCSFHVHVGRGGMPLKLQPVQRTASLLWIAEGLLNTLHAGCRLENMACYSLRNFSNLGMGMDAEPASQYIDEGGETAEIGFPFHLVDKNKAKPTDYFYTQPLDITESASSTPSRNAAADYDVEMVLRPREISPCKIDVVDGMMRILRTADTREVAELLSSSWRRGAYNFANLSHYALGGVPERDSLAWARSEVPKSTIEFRQAAGSLDDNWIAIWIKICLALCGPAVVDSSDADFYQLLYNCAKAEKNPREYDVFDLLHDIGLGVEDIDTVYSRLVSGRHEKEPVLSFHQPEDCQEILLVENVQDFIVPACL